MIFYTKSYTRWKKGTPLAETPDQWWATYHAGPGQVVEMVVAEDSPENGMHGHPVMLLVRSIPPSVVLEDGSLRELTAEELAERKADV